MLTSLYINNILLIEELSISFSQGFSVLLGDTGSGKSMIIECLGMISGDRVKLNIVRDKTRKATVAATFDIKKNNHALLLLQEHEINHDNGTIVIKKVITSNGKSKMYVCDTPVCVSFVNMLTNKIIEINGQFSQSSIINIKEHCSILDEYANLQSMLKSLEDKFLIYTLAEAKLHNLEEELCNKIQQKEYHQNIIDDIERLSLKPDEELDLMERRKHFAKNARLLKTLQESLNSLKSHNIVGHINSAENSILRATENDQANNVKEWMDKITNHIASSSSEIQEAIGLIEDFLISYNDGNNTLESIDDRIHELRTIAIKYNTSVNTLSNMLIDSRAKIEAMNSVKYDIEHTKNEVELARAEYLKIANYISEQRHFYAKKLSAFIIQELNDLKMHHVRFVVNIDSDVGKISVNGIDNVYFLASMNLGLDPAPLHKIASGGELSRFMLAFRTVLSRHRSGTIVFDEIDTGISGNIADAIGIKMATLSKTMQVISITHSPQVASRADYHFKVQKITNNCTSFTSITTLKTNDIVKEIAKMISGTDVTPTAISAAQSLLSNHRQH